MKWLQNIGLHSALWALMAWRFSTRTSVATVLSTHPSVFSFLGVNCGSGSLRPQLGLAIHFTYSFPIIIQIRQKIGFCCNFISVYRVARIFCPCHSWIFCSHPGIRIRPISKHIYTEFELRVKKLRWNGLMITEFSGPSTVFRRVTGFAVS